MADFAYPWPEVTPDLPWKIFAELPAKLVSSLPAALAGETSPPLGGAIKRGFEFTFMFTSLLVLLVYIAIQVGMTIYVFVATLVFCGFIISDTSLLLKRHTYSESTYVIAAISLYLDVINLLMAQLSFNVQ
ncbi:protein LIFEGUARD 4-like [Phragmites australis]|uniref:protein LIFEGUARD 4-like n=1 Tax=Phragmites australis TaxID=29695 RepID=UPI002D79F2A4|nr:protein LIFEGUARD 4-like [Phragmites australis]